MVERKYVMYLALGFEAAGLIVAFLFIGNWLDTKYGWQGLGVAGGALIGIVVWIVHAFMVFRTLEKNENTGDNPPE